MQTHLVLLRGINVSGQKLIKMEALRRQLENAGFENVATYIQSGNVLVDTAEKSKTAVAEKIKKLILDEYGFDVGVIVINHSDIEKAIRNNPFIAAGDSDTKPLYISFLSEEPKPENVQKLGEANTGQDIAIVKGDVIYLKYVSGAGNSKLTNALIENRLKLVSTSRNWNTTLKLESLLAGRK